MLHGRFEQRRCRGGFNPRPPVLIAGGEDRLRLVVKRQCEGSLILDYLAEVVLLRGIFPSKRPSGRHRFRSDEEIVRDKVHPRDVKISPVRFERMPV